MKEKIKLKQILLICIMLAFFFFCRHMEKGELIRSYSQPQKWIEVQPGSIDETEWKIACNQ